MKTIESMNKKTYCVPTIQVVRLNTQVTLLAGSYTESTGGGTQDGGSLQAPSFLGDWDDEWVNVKLPTSE